MELQTKTSLDGLGLPTFTCDMNLLMLSPKSGITSSQASHISNLCNQKASVIDDKIASLGVGIKTIMFQAVEYQLLVTNEIPENIAELLTEKGTLHATQAYLMESIKYKELLLTTLRDEMSYTSLYKEPDFPVYLELLQYFPVKEAWAWSKLTQEQWQEYLQEEALASHIGKFIHEKGKLTQIRKDLTKIRELEWYNLNNDSRVPVKLTPHKTSVSADLFTLHEKLATLHRSHESRVNYYKAMVKNMLSDENARLANECASKNAVMQEKNMVLRQEYKNQRDLYLENVRKENQLFESFRENTIKFVSSCRIKVPERFKKTIDMFMKDI